MISPTIGRVVLVHQGKAHGENDQPVPALITHVLGDRLVHVTGFTASGALFSYTPLALLQDDDAKPDDAPYAFWMPYQKEQAAAAAAKSEGKKDG